MTKEIVVTAIVLSIGLVQLWLTFRKVYELKKLREEIKKLREILQQGKNHE